VGKGVGGLVGDWLAEALAGWVGDRSWRKSWRLGWRRRGVAGALVGRSVDGSGVGRGVGGRSWRLGGRSGLRWKGWRIWLAQVVGDLVVGVGVDVNSRRWCCEVNITNCVETLALAGTVPVLIEFTVICKLLVVLVKLGQCEYFRRR
jgi:hypothetical protein